MPTVKNADENYALKFSSEDEDIATYIDGVVKALAPAKLRLESNWKITKNFAEAIINCRGEEVYGHL